jgi:hypothetical protein
MNLRVKSGLILFIVFLVVSLTPAFAVQMEQVANDAKNYDIESKQKKGFFAKIKFMVKGYSLINKAKKAQKESGSGNKISSNSDQYDEIWKQDKLSKIQEQKLLNFRNNEKNILNVSSTDKSIVNNSNRTDNQTPENIVIPQECHNDAQNMIEQLKVMGVEVSKTVQTEINPELTGNIVQIIDENGQIRYAYIETISLHSDSRVTLITDKNKKLVMTLDDFKKIFKGIVLTIDLEQNSKTVMGKIIEIQKNNLEAFKNKTLKAKEKAQIGTVITSILIGVGLILVIVGILIATYFGKQLITQANQQAARAGSLTASVDNPASWAIDKGAYSIEHYDDKFALDQARTVFKDGFASGAGFSELMTILGVMGITVSFIITLEIIGHVACQNWVKVILCVVGLIIALVGLVLMGFSICALIHNIMNIHDTNEALKEIDNKNNYLENWLNKSEILPEITEKDSKINIKENKTEIVNGLNQISGQNNTFHV